MAIFGHFWRFWPGSYRGLFLENGQKSPFLAKMAKKGHFGG